MGRPRRRGATSRPSRKSRPGPRRITGRGSSGGVDITGVSPIGNVSGYSPKIQASFRDRRGTPLSRDDIRVRLDGREIRNFQYRRTTGNLSFAVGRLAPGSHTVQVEVSGNGKGARKTWSFVVG